MVLCAGGNNDGLIILDGKNATFLSDIKAYLAMHQRQELESFNYHPIMQVLSFDPRFLVQQEKDAFIHLTLCDECYCDAI